MAELHSNFFWREQKESSSNQTACWKIQTQQVQSDNTVRNKSHDMSYKFALNTYVMPGAYFISLYNTVAIVDNHIIEGSLAVPSTHNCTKQLPSSIFQDYSTQDREKPACTSPPALSILQESLTQMRNAAFPPHFPSLSAISSSPVSIPLVRKTQNES